MENKNQWQCDDNFIDKMLKEAFGYADEQLIAELDAAVEEVGRGATTAPNGEFQRICNRIEWKNERTPKRRKSVKLGKIARFVVAAAVVGSMVLGSAMWVGARRTREYEIRERSDLDNVVVFNNNPDSIVIFEDEESKIEEAYAQIEKELEIQVYRLSYLPQEMTLFRLIILEGKSIIEFTDGSAFIFFYQCLNDNTSSFSYTSDMEEYQRVYNPFLDKEIPIYKKESSDNHIEFSTRIVKDNTYYVLQGILDIEQFKKIVCGIKLYKE